MTRRWAIAIALVSIALSSRSASAQRSINERRAVVPAGFVRIFAPSGFVRVVAWEKDSLAVTGTVHEPAGDRFVVEATARGARVGLWGENDGRLPPSNVTVYVPRNSQVWVKTGGANVDVAGVNGALDLFSTTGTLNVSGSPKSIYAETMGGGINVLNASTAAARLKTASGAIRVSGTVTDLTAVTVSGAINTGLARFGRARIESVEGPIRFVGPVPPQAVMDVVNHAGSITLVIPPATSADFAFNLYEADLLDEFGIKKRWMMAKGKDTREMSFGIGDRATSARVMIRSFKGQVAIRKQPTK